MTITLSTGEVVHFKEKFTHGADKAWGIAFSEGVYYEGEGSLGKVPTSNLALAYEAALPHTIQKVVATTGEFPCTLEWLAGLPVDDFRKLDIEARKMRVEALGGKKKD